MRLIQNLDEKDKGITFSTIDIMLTKKKFKDFFQKNVSTLSPPLKVRRGFCFNPKLYNNYLCLDLVVIIGCNYNYGNKC